MTLPLFRQCVLALLDPPRWALDLLHGNSCELFDQGEQPWFVGVLYGGIKPFARGKLTSLFFLKKRNFGRYLRRCFFRHFDFLVELSPRPYVREKFGFSAELLWVVTHACLDRARRRRPRAHAARRAADVSYTSSRTTLLL